MLPEREKHETSVFKNNVKLRRTCCGLTDDFSHKSNFTFNQNKTQNSTKLIFFSLSMQTIYKKYEKKRFSNTLPSQPFEMPLNNKQDKQSKWKLINNELPIINHKFLVTRGGYSSRWNEKEILYFSGISQENLQIELITKSDASRVKNEPWRIFCDWYFSWLSISSRRQMNLIRYRFIKLAKPSTHQIAVDSALLIIQQPVELSSPSRRRRVLMRRGKKVWRRHLMLNYVNLGC